MRKIYTIFLLPAFLLFACSTPDRLNETRVLSIQSLPEGAPIIVNGLNLGEAPLEIEFETNEFGCFAKPALITALPQKADLNTQVVSFPAYSQNAPEKSAVPEKIVFDMKKSPTEQGAVQIIAR